ncbi:MAG: ABC transporter substrate-binding protein [Clostridium sp.]|nr:ABC transporter substrate-binding protein [Clostridium sp.]
MKKNIISIISIAICAIIVLIVFGGVAFINDKKRQIGTIIIWADEEEYDYINTVAQQFIMENEDFDIEIEKINSENYKEEIEKAISENKIPDIIEMDSQEILEFNNNYKNKLSIYNCEEIIMDNKNEFNKRAIQDVTIDNNMMAVPYTMNPLVLYLRQDMLKDYNYLPEDIKTWDDLISIGRDIYNKSNKNVRIINAVGKEYNYLVDLLIQQAISEEKDINKVKENVNNRIKQLIDNNILNFDRNGSFLARVSSINTYKEVKLLNQECRWQACNAPALSEGGNRFFESSGKSFVLIKNSDNRIHIVKEYINALIESKAGMIDEVINGNNFFSYNSVYSSSKVENQVHNFIETSPLVVMDNINKKALKIKDYKQYRELRNIFLN